MRIQLNSAVNRRQFLRRSAVAALAISSAGLISSPAQAETRIAARIAEAEQSHPLVPVLKLAAQSLEKLEQVSDYTAIVIKKEMIGTELLTTQMHFKLREEPRDVYLKFIDPHAGREVLYSPNKRNGNMLVHETGIASLVGAIEVDPTGSMATKENRYPITKIGLRNLMNLNIERWLSETKFDGIEYKYFPSAKIGDKSCKVVQITYNTKRPEFRYQSTRLYIDSATDLPIRVQNYDFPASAGGEPVLVEDYYYSEMKTNVGLKDIDFDPENPNYGF